MSTLNCVPLLGGDSRKLYFFMLKRRKNREKQTGGGSPGKHSNFWFFCQWACSLFMFSKQKKNKISSFIKKRSQLWKKINLLKLLYRTFEPLKLGI